MLDESYLEKGIYSLANSMNTGGWFRGGHIGSTLIHGYFYNQENHMEGELSKLYLKNLNAFDKHNKNYTVIIPIFCSTASGNTLFSAA